MPHKPFHIFINTKGRGPDKQRTWDSLTPKLWYKTTLAVTPDEWVGFVNDHNHGWTRDHLFCLPSNIIGLSAGRQYILEKLRPEIDYPIMMDDDLTFYRFGLPAETHVVDMIDHLLEVMMENAINMGMLGIVPYKYSPTEMISINEMKHTGEIMRCFILNRHQLLNRNIRFDKTRLLQDFSVNCQCRQNGLSVVRLEAWSCDDDGPVNAVDGGVSVYRSPVELIRTVYNLVNEYPNEIRKIIND